MRGRRGHGLLRAKQPAVRARRVLLERARAVRPPALHLRRQPTARVPGRLLSGTETVVREPKTVLIEKIWF